MLLNVRERLRQWRPLVIAVPAATLLLWGVRALGLLQPWEWAAFDQFTRWRGADLADDRIVIVGIEESDLAYVGTWPLPDAQLAELVEIIRAQEPRAIGLDLYRDLRVEPGHAAWVEIMQTTPNLVGVRKLVDDVNSRAIAAPPTLAALAQVGANDVVEDRDGRLRRGTLFLPDPDTGQQIPSLGLYMALLYLLPEGIVPEAAARNPDYMQLAERALPIFEANTGSYVGADAAGYQVLLNYRGPAGTFMTVSLAQVLEGEIEADLFRDRVVLIGPTATSLNDYFLTPFSSGWASTPERMAGVEIHANVASQILSAALENRALWQTWPDSLEWLWIVGWTTAGAGVCFGLRLRPITGLGLVGLAILCGGLSWSAFTGLTLWLPVVPPLLGLTLAAGGIAGYLANQERIDRQVAMTLFGQQLTTEVAEALWRDRHQLLTTDQLRGETLLQTREGTALAGRYHLTKVLARGGFGQTFLAQDNQRPGSPVCVVKQLLPRGLDDNGLAIARRLFATEAETLEKLGHHPQIPALLAYFEQGEQFFLVQEFIEGNALSQELVTGQRLSETRVIAILWGLLPVLGFIHKQQVIHRDLKPDNIIRRKTDRKLVLIDFGGVKQMRGDAGDSNTVAIGTLGYTPTEQLAGRPQYNSDLYALGMIALQALVGKRPDLIPEDPNTGELGWQPLVEISPAFRQILTRLTRRNTQERYPAASAVLRDLYTLPSVQAALQQKKTAPK